MKIKICKQCSKEFEVTPKAYKRMFCDKKCSNVYQRNKKLVTYQSERKEVLLRDRWAKWTPQEKLAHKAICTTGFFRKRKVLDLC